MTLDQQVSAADIKITSMNASARRIRSRVEVTTTVEILTNNDDDARNVQCIVVLPPTSRVVASNPPAVLGPAYPAVGPASGFVQSEPVNGYAVFEPGAPLTVDGSLTFALVTHVHESWAEAPISAFVFSSVPDPDPSNDFSHTHATLSGRH